MPHYVFIDTNMLLSLYDYTSDDLEKLQKLSDAVAAGEIVSLTTSQVKDEYKRNRAGKISTVLKSISSKALGSYSLPRICEGLPEYKVVQDAAKELAASQSALFKAVESTAASGKLKADKLIKKLLTNSKCLEVGSRERRRARQRRDIGNPPGKRDSLGDQINWETLLEQGPDNIKLNVLSVDGDWKSELTGEINEVIAEEWGDKKGGEIVLLKTLNDFLKAAKVDVVVDVDPEKEKQVNTLVSSGSFSTTHAAIAVLGNYNSFNPNQVASLVSAALNNNQVGWVLTDDDVKAFYKKLISKHHQLISDKDLNALNKGME